MMEQEVGDGTNFVIILAGALLKEAEDLVRKFNFLLFTVLLRIRDFELLTSFMFFAKKRNLNF